MNFKSLFNDDRAVSPVIGVILMVAITVILAAVIGTFVLGLGNNVSTTPQAQFGFDVGSSNSSGAYNVTVTHESGDTISATALTVSANGSENTWADSGDVSAGSSIVVGNVNASSPRVNAWVSTGDTVRVIYDNPDSDKTATLAKKEVS